MRTHWIQSDQYASNPKSMFKTEPEFLEVIWKKDGATRVCCYYQMDSTDINWSQAKLCVWRNFPWATHYWHHVPQNDLYKKSMITDKLTFLFLFCRLFLWSRYFSSSLWAKLLLVGQRHHLAMPKCTPPSPVYWSKNSNPCTLSFAIAKW